MYGNYLFGQHVKHTAFGPGTIINHNDNHITIKYENGRTSLMVYPNAVEKFLTFEDVGEQRLALIRLDEIKAKEEQEMQEILRKYEEEKIKKEEEKKLSNAIKCKEYAIAKKKKYYEQKRLKESTPTWLVYQGFNYEKEFSGQYLFVPDNFDRTMPFWDSIEELRRDDVIFHVKAQNIVAISKVWKTSHKWEDNEIGKGLRVCTDYIQLSNPLDLRPLREEIAEYHQESHSPFNKHGKGIQGYLFPLDYPLAKAFLTQIVKDNDELGGINYIKNIIEN